MSFTWHEIFEHLMQSSSTLGFQRDFDVIRRDHGYLSGFREPAAVLDTLHGGVGEHDAKNSILTSLVMAAQSEGAGTNCALTLMLLALWPGLDAAMRRSKRRRLGHADELPSEILARATEATRCLDLSRVNWIAATILRNIERDLMRAHQREADRQRQHADIDPDEVLVGVFAGGPEIGLGRLFDEVTHIVGVDAKLVFRVAVDGFSQAEVAVELGLSNAATRKRYQRATRRLRDAMQKNA
ncbi:MAG TPA: hypothetical protein DIT67_12525 [Octadecabacter sp.]|nr:hypothetical protein [Octadecabacter sp.]